VLDGLVALLVALVAVPWLASALVLVPGGRRRPRPAAAA
jgi:hypothetical protein